MIVDLFAGPGGWDEGLRRNGRTDVLGVELDRDACNTATAAGHERQRADVYGADPAGFAGEPIDLIGSPPCGGIAKSGKRAGIADLDLVVDLLNCVADGGCDCRADYLMAMKDHRSLLMVEPMRWVVATGARSLILEQVPEALPIWQEYVEHLIGGDWWAECGVLNAADFGVPQDRQRAILVAHRDRPVYLPTPTHEGAWVGADTVLGPGVVGFPRLNDRPDGGKYRARDMRSTAAPSFTVTEKARSWTFIPEGGRPRQITEDEAGRLQSFPGAYPWSGPSRSGRFLQIANAVPPTLAQAVTAAVLDPDGGKG